MMKRSKNTAFLKDFKILEDIIDVYVPKPGDIALFQVNELGTQTKIIDENEHLISLNEDDYLLSSIGNAFNDENLIGVVPNKPERNLQILNNEAVIGKVNIKNSTSKNQELTKVTLIGYAVDINENILNIQDQSFKSNTVKRRPLFEFLATAGIFLSLKLI